MGTTVMLVDAQFRPAMRHSRTQGLKVSRSRGHMRRRDFLAEAAALAAVPTLRFRAPLRVNGERLNAALGQFDAIGRTATGINRVAYSDFDLAGRKFTIDLIRAAGLEP